MKTQKTYNVYITASKKNGTLYSGITLNSTVIPTERR